MRAAFIPAVRMLLVLTLVTGVLYPLTVTGVAALFPGPAGGSLVREHGVVVGSARIGRSFTRPGEFWGRPSATARWPYDASASGGSNLGPTNPALERVVRERIAALRAADPGNRAPVPVDLVTASASGLDPHISPAAAEFQVARVARARGLAPAAVRSLVARATEGPTWGVLGEPRVDVARLNRLLDAAARP